MLRRSESTSLVPITANSGLPAVIADAGSKAGRRFLEFFTANIRNKNTRVAYGRAVMPFLDWCEKHGGGAG